MGPNQLTQRQQPRVLTAGEGVRVGATRRDSTRWWPASPPQRVCGALSPIVGVPKCYVGASGNWKPARTVLIDAACRVTAGRREMGPTTAPAATACIPRRRKSPSSPDHHTPRPCDSLGSDHRERNKRPRGMKWRRRRDAAGWGVVLLVLALTPAATPNHTVADSGSGMEVRSDSNPSA